MKHKTKLSFFFLFISSLFFFSISVFSLPSNGGSAYIDTFKADVLDITVDRSSIRNSSSSSDKAESVSSVGRVRTVSVEYRGLEGGKTRVLISNGEALKEEEEESSKYEAEDTNRDGYVSPLDSLIIINLIKERGTGEYVNSQEKFYADINRDGYITPLDVLLVINKLNSMSTGLQPTSTTSTSASVTTDSRREIPLTDKTFLKVLNGEKGGAIVSVKYDGSNNPNVINYSGLNGQGVGSLASKFIVNYTYAAKGDFTSQGTPILEVDVYSGTSDSKSTCKGYLSDRKTLSNGYQSSANGQMEIEFSKCTQVGSTKTDFSNIGALVFRVMTDGRNLLDFTINQIAIDAVSVMSPEDFQIQAIGGPEDPPDLAPPSPSPSMSASVSRSASPSSSSSASQSPSASASSSIQPSPSASASSSIVPSQSPSASMSASPSPSASPPCVPSGCDNQCGSNNVVDACGVCGGDGSSCQCLFVASWTLNSGYIDSPDLANKHIEILSNLNVQRTQALPNCLVNKIKDRCLCGENTRNDASCLSQIRGIQQDSSVKIWGGCFVPSRGGILDFTVKSQVNAIADILGIPENGSYTHRKFEGTDLNTSAHWYFDQNCNYVQREIAQNQRLCGYAGISWSPISLILDEKIGLNEDMPVVEFNLTGKEDQGFVLWKASSSTPLLVYDPENKYEVESAKQLFGNFAFGGKTNKVSDFNKKGYRDPWKNGYEALELLDQNLDKKLSGEELRTLKLWFDYNRDGKSDKGEVQSLKENQIVNIFFANPSSIVDSKDVELSVGYERIVDGKSVLGKSVDWFSETFSSKAEASSAVMGIFKKEVEIGNGEFSSSVKEPVPLINTLEDSIIEPKGVGIDQSVNLSGNWIWTILEKGAENNPGIFIISERVDGELYGYTISSAKLAENKNKIDSAIFAIPGYGKIERFADRESQIKLVFKDASAGGFSESIASLSKDGTIMKGTTTQSFEVKIKGEIRSAKVNYDWVATKSTSERK